MPPPPPPQVSGDYARGSLEGCDVRGNKGAGIWVYGGADLTLVGNTIRDHKRSEGWTRSGAGLYVDAASFGRVAVGASNVFASNEAGDCVREKPEGCVIC